MRWFKTILILLLAIGFVGLLGYFYTRNANKVKEATGVVPQTLQQNILETNEITIVASEYKFTPSEVRIKKGESVKLILKNEGKMPHDWVVEDLGGASVDITGANALNSIEVRPSQKGTFTVFCSVGNHRSLGMVGKLIVE